MLRPFIPLLMLGALAAACATSPRAVPGPTPARRGDTTSTTDTTKQDTSATRDTVLRRAPASSRAPAPIPNLWITP